MFVRNVKKVFKYIFSKRPIRVQADIKIVSQSEYLRGRTALITGGSSGIGYAIAKAFLEAGATVVITGRSKERLDHACNELKKDIKSQSQILSYVFDNKNVSEFSKYFSEICSLLGHRQIDILVNNAGVNGQTIESVTEEEYDIIMDTNLKASFFLSRMVGRYMIEHQIKGNILNIASASSLRPANSPYGLSKWGIRGLTLGLAKTLIKHGIVVNGIAPGPTVTPMMRMREGDNLYNNSIPLGRFIHPAEIAGMAVYLVGDMCRSIVGDIIYMTGGAGNISFDGINYNI